MRKIHSRVRGTTDFYPPLSSFFYKVTQKARKLFEIFGYKEVILPLLEEESLFRRSVGEGSDIVSKQMFKIESQDIVLRPEGTAGVVRFYLENDLPKKGDFWKFFYIGPMFRGERPQKGRLRQFHHIGAEVIGSDSFYLDGEIINLAISIVKETGVSSFSLEINSLGCKEDKEKLSTKVKELMKGKESMMCPNCQKRLVVNPLRIFDCKQQECQRIISSLDLKDEYLCQRCKQEFSNLLSLLKDLNIEYKYNPYLVRGLDYYTNTVFEIKSSQLGSQDAIGAGGRYNDLIYNLGGKKTPSVGFALGLERILLLMEPYQEESSLKVFVAYPQPSTFPQAYHILNHLRKNNIAAEIDYKGKSLKAQLKYSQKLGALFTVILGEEELQQNCAIVRDMSKAVQKKVALEELVPFLKDSLNSLS